MNNIKKILKKIFEKVKINKFLSIMLGFIVLCVIVFFTFFYDIGINSKYFVKKDFSEAFLARQTGNCEEFVKYLNQDWANWVARCYQEKNHAYQSQSIKSFTVKEITINGNRSFLQVELQRDNLIKSGAVDYVVNYEMVRISGKWFIDQLMQ